MRVQSGQKENFTLNIISPTTGRIHKVLRTTLRSQTELESTHYQETETNWFNPLNAELIPICRLLALLEAHYILHISRIRVKSKRNQLANREKIQPVYRKQTTSLQSGDQTHLDLRNRTLGMCQQIQHSIHADSTIKNPQNHNKCSLVCDKPYPPYRP